MGTTVQIAEKIILFDGVCNLCNGAVNFVIDHDKKDRFKFASLQSTAAQELLSDSHIDPSKLDSIVLVDESGVCNKSKAVLRISKDLGFPVSLLFVFRFIPTSISDWLYDVVARNRYSWFGQLDACRIPTPELKNKFLD